MNEHIIHYCFILSEEQMKYLRSKKYKIDRMECFMSLVELAGRETELVQISKTQQVEILPGQVMVDNTQLAKLWDKDRKTVPKLIEAMETLGISRKYLLKMGGARRIFSTFAPCLYTGRNTVAAMSASSSWTRAAASCVK